ncbi:hypothetical protein E4U39_001915 [Claviceps sp. Clav50 group G5]|nr:hypothetical protein E4U39_001915 [Claviceps sp. Clav50 group G5]
MSAPAPGTPAVMPAPVNHPQNVDTVYGSGDKKLRQSYRWVSGNQDVSPSDLIQAMDSTLTGDAAMFVGKNALLGQIVDQADDLTTTVEDFALLESTLQDHFHIKPEVGIAHDGPFPNVVRGDGESLDAYHGRGCRSTAEETEGTSLSPLSRLGQPCLHRWKSRPLMNASIGCAWSGAGQG